MLHPSHPPHLSHLLSNPNNPTSGTTARVARNLALLVPALAQVVRAAVHDDGAAEHAFGPDELDLLVRQGALCVALGVRLEVAQVADVAFRVGGGAVGFGEGVDCISREGRGGFGLAGIISLGSLAICDFDFDFDLEGWFGIERRGGGADGGGAVEDITHNEDRRWCSRWCCRRIGGRACRARPRRRGL